MRSEISTAHPEEDIFFAVSFISIVCFHFQQAHVTSSRLPCLCSALLSASSTGVITESVMP